MRILEITLLAICTILPFYRPKWNKNITLSAIAVLAILHIFFEGYRWQMIPVYLILSILIFLTKTVIRGNIGFKILKISLTALLLIPAWVLPNAFPVFELPTPSGIYAVGTRSLHLVTDKNEDITPEPNDKRELMIKVWYPAAVQKEETETYFDKGERLGFTTKYKLPASTLDYLDYIKTHTYESPSVHKGKFPVLLFSPGIYSNASGYYALLEEVVSQGYIVLSVNHTYESMGSLFPNGEIKLYNQAFDKIHNNQENGEMIWSATQAFHNASDDKEEFEAIYQAVQDYVAADVNKRWSNDLSLLLDAVHHWNITSFLSEHMDTSRIGAFGHSQGGGAAAQILLDDRRVKAAINIDGVHWGNMIDTSMSKPFMLLSSDWDESHPNFNKHIYARQSTTDFYDVLLKNSGHASFMDVPLMVRVPIINEAGSINPKMAHKATSKVITSFFNRHIKNQEIELEQVTKEYLLLQITTRQTKSTP